MANYTRLTKALTALSARSSPAGWVDLREMWFDLRQHLSTPRLVRMRVCPVPVGYPGNVAAPPPECQPTVSREVP